MGRKRVLYFVSWGFAAIAIAVILTNSAWAAATERVVHSFNGVPDGIDPAATLAQDAAGNFYGTTVSGGTGTLCTNGCGTVFELSPRAGGKWKETVLYSFTGGSDGKNPYGGVTLDSKGEALDSYCRGKNIIAVSPNTLYAHLCVIHLGLRGMQIEENAKRISAGLSGIQKNMATFTDVFEKLGTHLKNAQQSYGEADKRLEKTQSTLDSLVGTSAADASLENGQGALALPAVTGAKTGA